MTDKITIEIEDLSKISDGYHTIQELYDHRCLLWINLILDNVIHEKCYLVKDHYEGWFLLGMFKDKEQISYHCPNKYLELVDGFVPEHLPEYDGHTPNDVIDRLYYRALFHKSKQF